MSELIEDFERLRNRYLDDIHRLIDEEIEEASPQDSSLVEMCRYHMQTGGKRLRALLPLAVAEALGEEASRLVPFGAACELLHNATLVHDDLQDGDRLRRGEPTVWVRYGRERAINLGDAMLYWTVLLLSRLDAPPAQYRATSERLLRQTVRVIDGQEREFLLKANERPTVEEYVEMVEGKTSGLFALPVAGSAELCGASGEIVAGLERVSGHLGVLFQIQDDVLDLYADKGREHRGTDICEGKMSVLVVHFLNEAPADEAGRVREVLTAPREEVDTEQIDEIAGSFRRRGSLEFALDEIERRRRSACEAEFLAEHPELKRLVCGMAELFLKPIEPVIARAR